MVIPEDLKYVSRQCMDGVHWACGLAFDMRRPKRICACECHRATPTRVD